MLMRLTLPTKESIPSNPVTGCYDFAALFGSDHPLEIEIGCGRGKFLAEVAASSPSINYIGIDRVMKWMRTGEKKRIYRQLSNLFFFKEEVRDFLSHLQPQSVSVFHMYFPDPWPKRRHRRRRLITADFLALLGARLSPQGKIELATDDLDYFEQMKAAAFHTESFWKNIRESNQRIRHHEIQTNYEAKFKRLGRLLYYLELEKL